MKDPSWLLEVALAFLKKKYVDFNSFAYLVTRRYPLHRYILGTYANAHNYFGQTLGR